MFMIRELSDETRRLGLNMNIAKTKVMVVDNTPVNVNKVQIENIEAGLPFATSQRQGKEPGQ